MKKFFIVGGGVLAVLIIIFIIMNKNILKFLPGFLRVSSNFGSRINPINKLPQFHNGVDLTAPNGSPVYAYNSGVISFFKNDIGGNQATITGKDYRTGYAHLKAYAPGIAAGQTVAAGQLIGFVGSTGQSTGNHLHFTYYKGGKYVDPFTLFNTA